MVSEYVNRRGDRYYLVQGKTRTGKPNYHASRKPPAVSVEMPEGYEFYEHPERGLVYVRRVQRSPVLPEERELLRDLTFELAGTKYFIVEIEADHLVVYTPATDPGESVSALSRAFGSLACSAAAAQDWFGKKATYLPMLRFTLADEEKRLFAVERWCFRGSIDGWFFLEGAKGLESHARKYLPHLNQESFFELF